MKLKPFYRVPPNEWLFTDRPDVLAARARAEAEPAANEFTIEEYVRQWVLRELLETYGYPREWLGERIVIEERVRMGSSEKEADIAVRNAGRRTYLFVETKCAGVTESEYQAARGQLESYLSATHTATVGMVTCVRQTQCLEKKIDPNDFNLIPDIPSYDKERVRYKSVLVRELPAGHGAGAKRTGLKPLDESFGNLLFECHSTIRDIDGLHDDEALDELCKLIFAKLHDERDACRQEEGAVFRFQVYGAGNTEEVASTIRALYEEARSYDVESNAQKIIGYERSRGVFKNQIRLSQSRRPPGAPK